MGAYCLCVCVCLCVCFDLVKKDLTQQSEGMNWIHLAPSSVQMNNFVETEMKNHVKKYNKQKCNS